ncbi:hypothetical protein TNCV_4054061 [Trichonephila clavipes]|nr:hypothetical protein TNCV_4054061 [Trichonephila clavipes]
MDFHDAENRQRLCRMIIRHGYFETLRTEMSGKNIDVTMLCPGPVFSNNLENAFTGTPGKKFGQIPNRKDRKMQTDRCARLMCVAIAHKLDEAWIAPQPNLIFFYLMQYTPTFFRKRECVRRLRLAFGDESPYRATVFKWFKEFYRGLNSLQGEGYIGRLRSAAILDNVSANGILDNVSANGILDNVSANEILDNVSVK